MATATATARAVARLTGTLTAAADRQLHFHKVQPHKGGAIGGSGSGTGTGSGIAGEVARCVCHGNEIKTLNKYKGSSEQQ